MDKEKEIRDQIERLEDVLEQREEGLNGKNLSWEEYSKAREPETSEIHRLFKELRLIKKPVYSKISDFGDIMTLEHFKENVECGGFIDYDGYGHYVKDGKESNIEIYPSDVKAGKVRENFDTIVWFNR